MSWLSRMSRRITSGFLLLATLAAARPEIRINEIPAPATAAAEVTGPSLTLSADGIAWLTWLEKTAVGTALRCATFDRATSRWNPPGTIASGANWFVNWADFPALTAGADGAATVVWFVNNPARAASAHDHHGPGYHALLSRTTDGGRTWSPPAPLTRDSDSVEFVSLATLADGRVLAAWLDGRARQRDAAKPQQLWARILGAAGPDTLVDPSVCDCCQTTLTAFPDGTALLAYRGRGAEEVRDIRVTRFRRGEWDEPRALNHDDWRIHGCPVNGPQLASDGGRVAAAWFIAADNDPRVLASFSPDAGARFLAPLRLDHVKPAGRVATRLLRDGAVLVSWVDAEGAVWLSRVTPEFAPADRVSLAPAQSGRTKGFPRLALLRDYEGGREAAQVLVAFTRDAAPSLRTLLVHVPEGELLEAEKNCDCAPSAEELRGYSFRGTIVEVQSAPASGEWRTVRVAHGGVPGIFEEGTRVFVVTPELAAQLPGGRSFLGRIERRGGDWRLFDVRLLATPAGGEGSEREKD